MIFSLFNFESVKYFLTGTTVLYQLLHVRQLFIDESDDRLGIEKFAFIRLKRLC